MENHEYIVKFENTNFNIGEFVVKGESVLYVSQRDNKLYRIN